MLLITKKIHGIYKAFPGLFTLDGVNIISSFFSSAKQANVGYSNLPAGWKMSIVEKNETKK